MPLRAARSSASRTQKKIIRQLTTTVKDAEKDKKNSDINCIVSQLEAEPDGTMAGTIAEWLRQGSLQKAAHNISRENSALSTMLGKELPPSTRKFNRLRPDTLSALLMAFEPAIFTQAWLFGDFSPPVAKMKSWVCFALNVKETGVGVSGLFCSFRKACV